MADFFCAGGATLDRRTNGRLNGRLSRSVFASERLRAEFIAGAEEEWRRRAGRAMTAEELERLLRRYPGDV